MTEAEAKADAEDFITQLETGGSIIPPVARPAAVSYLTARLIRCAEQGAIEAIDDVLDRLDIHDVPKPAAERRPRRR